MSLQVKILWVVLIVTNITWIVAFGMVNKGRANEADQRQQIEKQRDACRSQVSTLNDTMGKLCACGK